MDFMYDEISENNKIHLKKHLAECEDCRSEFEELQQVPNFLDKWQEEPAPMHITFTAEENSFVQFIKNLFPDFGIVKKVGFGFATVLFVMAMFNTKIEMKDGNFTFETSLLKKSEPQVLATELSPEMLDQLKYENFKLTSQLLENYETKNDKKTMTMMNTLVSEIRKERSNEYDNLINTVSHAYETNDMRIQQTNHTVGEILDLLNTSAQSK